VKIGFRHISKQQREQRFFNPSSSIRYCGSRAVTALAQVWARAAPNVPFVSGVFVFS
jgi:hypothetical protein